MPALNDETSLIRLKKDELIKNNFAVFTFSMIFANLLKLKNTVGSQY